MKVLNVGFKNFRNLSNIEFSANEKMNVICGDNAQGKTNIIEGIWLFTGAKSFRKSKDNEMIAFGKNKAEVFLEFDAFGIKSNAKIEIESRKIAVLNEKKLSHTSLLAGNFNAIVFSPTDINIVSDGPAVRRRFLDIAIGQLYPKYIFLLREYLRAVKQRNSILKDIVKDPSKNILLDDFEEAAAINGEKIIEYRLSYIERLKNFSSEIYSGIANKKEMLFLNYEKSYSGDLRQALFNSRKTDMFKGTTGVGPHRDDISFYIENKSAKEFASQGQKRSVALSLKLGEAAIIKEITGEQPVALLDDVMSELDKERQSFILNHIKDWQVFITLCDENQTNGLSYGKIIKVEKGEIK